MKTLKSVSTYNKANKYKLHEEFTKAMHNQDFKDLRKRLKASDELLEQHTSKLEDAAKEYKNCKNCKGLPTCKNPVKGYCYFPIIEGNKISFAYQECKYQTKYIKENSYQENIYLYKIPSDIKHANFKNIYTDDKNRITIIKYMKEFIDNYQTKNQKGIYLHGNFGSGKTYLIGALFNELAKKNEQSAIIYFPEFLSNLKSSFNNDFNDRLEYIKKVKFLLIDDIGAENVTNFSRDEILGPILQYRMQENLPTFFTSNLTIKGLEEHLSMSSTNVDKVKARRIIERIKYLTKDIKLVSINRRK